MPHKDTANKTTRSKKSNKRKDKLRRHGKYSAKATRTKINHIQTKITTKRSL